ncbi:MAG TPA: helix-turn-helix transcriptional regulator [Ktedonobacteraceae bacterium]|nr:helix-turn-helix transcriptional regulator [Ktedonobacteraceae bacterium]
MYRLRVKEILEGRELSMAKLSRGADVPLNTVRRLVKDRAYNPTAYTLRRVAEYLGMTMDDLYINDEEDSGSQ